MRLGGGHLGGVRAGLGSVPLVCLPAVFREIRHRTTISEDLRPWKRSIVVRDERLAEWGRKNSAQKPDLFIFSSLKKQEFRKISGNKMRSGILMDAFF